MAAIWNHENRTKAKTKKKTNDIVRREAVESLRWSWSAGHLTWPDAMTLAQSILVLVASGLIFSLDDCQSDGNVFRIDHTIAACRCHDHYLYPLLSGHY
jgi:hypothetical protein